MATLEWNKLLCTKRERESKSGSSINPVRNEFEADYDRIVLFARESVLLKARNLLLKSKRRFLQSCR